MKNKTKAENLSFHKEKTNAYKRRASLLAWPAAQRANAAALKAAACSGDLPFAYQDTPGVPAPRIKHPELAEIFPLRRNVHQVTSTSNNEFLGTT